IRLDGNQFIRNTIEDFGINPNLNYIDLSNNQFYGEFSCKWGECRNLRNLKISNNNISKIPKELGRLTSLMDLSLQGNQLSGNIPLTTRILHDLQTLNLAANNLSGSLGRRLETV
ncbi:Leucine-rich repeat - like 10, partial [Theobroma cacao]